MSSEISQEHDIQYRLLLKLYDDYYISAGWGATDWGVWSDEIGFDKATVAVAARSLIAQGMGQSTRHGELSLTSYGVLFAEKSGCAAPEIVQANKKCRSKILRALYDLKHQEQPVVTVQRELLMRSAAVSGEDFDRQRIILIDKDYVEKTVNGTYRLTDSGEQFVQKIPDTGQILSTYNALLGDTHNPRGRALRIGALICVVAEIEGWEVQPNVPTTGREYDFEFNRDKTRYVLECKWMAERLRPHLLEPLRKHVDSQPDRIGIFVSMAGFALETIRQTVKTALRCPILLFGPLDIDHLMNGRTTLVELIAKKQDALLVKGLAIVDGRSVSL